MVKSYWWGGWGGWVAHVIIVIASVGKFGWDFGLIFWTQTLDSGLQASDSGLSIMQ